jgi:glutathionylspermidine synthase
MASPTGTKQRFTPFTLREIEDDLEAATATLEAMCLELAARAVTDDRLLNRLTVGRRRAGRPLRPRKRRWITRNNSRFLPHAIV